MSVSTLSSSATPAKRFDALRAVADLANSDWARPLLYALATPHFIYFSSLWIALPWLAVSLGLEAAFLIMRARAANDPRWRDRAGLFSLVLPWPWLFYSVVMWVHGGSAALAGALCAQFTCAVIGALTPRPDKTFLMVSLAPPVLLVFAMLAAAYAQAVPLIILPVAMCSALGITVVMFAAAQASHDNQQRLRQMRAELKAERDALDQRVRERTADLALATERAEAANRAKSQFLANMSHELRTPLNAVIGYAEIVIDDLGAAGLQSSADDVEKIRFAGRNLLALINDVLDLAKADTNQLKLNCEQTDVAALVREAVDLARPAAAAKSNRLDLTISPAVAPIACDVARMKQALRNLLSNACKFTANGTITVSATIEEGAWLTIRVSDTGVGMGPQQLEQLFRPFTQADSSRTRTADGAGLGLVVTRNFARLMGGDIWVDSAPGQGSAFTLRLPSGPGATQAVA